MIPISAENVLPSLQDTAGCQVRFKKIFQRKNDFCENCCKLSTFADVVGAVDGSLIPINKPPGSGWQYHTRKGFTAINMVAVADGRRRFLFVNANYPGSCHDSPIFNGSALQTSFEQGEFVPGYVLLGDSAFRNTNFVLTPVGTPRNTGEEHFNAAHKKTRCVIEESFGMLKNKFKILQTSIRLQPFKAAQVIIACVALHNYAINCGAARLRSLRPANRRQVTLRHPPVNCPDIRAFLAAQM